jgi:outer membrane protein OmpA-like peptidoglycan-associated protein
LSHRFSWIKGVPLSIDQVVSVDKAPQLVLQLVLGPDDVAQGAAVKVVVYDLDLYLSHQQEGDSIAAFRGGGSALPKLPAGVFKAMQDGVLEQRVQQAGTGVLLVIEGQLLVRPPEEVKQLDQRYGTKGVASRRSWCPFFLHAARAASFSGAHAYELGLWLDQKLEADSPLEQRLRTVHKPAEWLGLQGTVRYPEADARALLDRPARKLVVRLVAMKDAGPSVPAGTAFITTINPKNDTRGERTRPVEVDHSGLRRFLAPAPGGPGASPGAGAPSIPRRVSVDVTGYFEEVVPGKKPGEGTPPSFLHLSQVGHGRIGWYTPFAALGPFTTDGEPRLGRSRGVFKGRIGSDPQRTEGAWKAVNDVTGARASGAMDPASISDDFERNVRDLPPEPSGERGGHRELLLTVLDPDPKRMRIRVELFGEDAAATPPTTWPRISAEFVRRHGRSRLPWTAVEKVEEASLMNATADPSELKEAVTRTEVEPIPAAIVAREIGLRLLDSALQTAVDEFADGKHVSAFQGASRVLGQMFATAGGRDHQEQALFHFRILARGLTITARTGARETKTALEWLELMLAALVNEKFQKEKDKPGGRSPEQILAGVLKEHDDPPHGGGGFRAARLATFEAYNYKLEFVGIVKVSKDAQSGGGSGGGELFLVDVTGYDHEQRPLPGWELDPASTEAKPEDRIKPVRYHGVLGSIGVGFGFAIDLTGESGKPLKSDSAAGAPSGVFKSLYPLKPADFDWSAFSVATVGVGGLKTPLPGIGQEPLSSALVMLTARPAGVEPVTLYAIIEKFFEPKTSLEVPEWGLDNVGNLKDQLKSMCELKLHIASVSMTVGFFVKAGSHAPAARTVPDPTKVTVQEQSTPVDVSVLQELRVFFDRGKDEVKATARLDLDYRLAMFRRLLEKPGFVKAIGYTSPEWKEVPKLDKAGRRRFKEDQQQALSQRRAAAVVQAITDAVGGPGGGLVHKGQRYVAEGLGSRGAYEVGLLLDPDDPDDARECLSCGKRYSSPARPPLSTNGGACVTRAAGHGVETPLAIDPARFRRLVDEDEARYPEWRRVDVFVNGILVARLRADG